jgi:hypothetical protein
VLEPGHPDLAITLHDLSVTMHELRTLPTYDFISTMHMSRRTPAVNMLPFRSKMYLHSMVAHFMLLPEAIRVTYHLRKPIDSSQAPSADYAS